MTIPIIQPARKFTILRWDLSLVGRCENCDAHTVLLLHDQPSICPVCGMHHQVVSLNIRGEAILPGEVGFHTISFTPPKVQP
jgi:hypothetical protein